MEKGIPLPLWADINPHPPLNAFVQCTNWTAIGDSPVAREHPSMVNRGSGTMLRDPQVGPRKWVVKDTQEAVVPHVHVRDQTGAVDKGGL